MTAVRARILANQAAKGRFARASQAGATVGFAFSTMERTEFTRRTLASVDSEPGFDILWVDGSTSHEGRRLPHEYRFRHARVAEAYNDVRGGPNAAIKFGLRRLLELGYDYVGLLENDVVLEPGWFTRLTELFDLAAADGLAVGAATVRSFTSRVLEYEPGYSINWNIGAGLILFTREAAGIVLNGYDRTPTTARTLRRFYGDLAGVDLKPSWELWFGRPDRRLSADWGYDILLYRHGLATVASIPNLALDLEFDTLGERRTPYVTGEADGSGPSWPPFGARQRMLMTLSDPAFRIGWSILRRRPGLIPLSRDLYLRGMPKGGR